MRPILLSCCLFTAAVVSSTAEPPVHVKAEDIRPERELLITDPAVLDSDYAKYPGPWSFGALMEELFGKEQAPEAVYRWLLCYSLESTVGQPQLESEPMIAGGAGLPPHAEKSKPTPPGKAGDATGTGPKIAPRPDFVREFIQPWQQRDGFDPRSGEIWKPNLAHAPFRLLAIVNRMDLGAPQLVHTEEKMEDRWKSLGRGEAFSAMIGLSTFGIHGLSTKRLQEEITRSAPPASYYGPGGLTPRPTFTRVPTSVSTPAVSTPTDFGEGRLIFAAVGADGQPLDGAWTIILEYKLTALPKGGPNKKGVAETVTARDWAQTWHWLGSLETKDPQFAKSLVEITRAFTHRAPGNQGGLAPASFSQLRSSEAAFGPGREFRQFQLQEGNLIPALLPSTPGVQFMTDRPDGGRLLGGFLHDIEPLVRVGIHAIPTTLELHHDKLPFLGATALIPAGEKDFHWDPAPHLTRDARRVFSTNTCNGCHAGETGCPDGLHVHPRAEGVESQLSAFLRRDGQPDRFPDPGFKMESIQLTEMQDRATILAALLEPKESRQQIVLEDLLRDRLRRSH